MYKQEIVHAPPVRGEGIIIVEESKPYIIEERRPYVVEERRPYIVEERRERQREREPEPYSEGNKSGSFWCKVCTGVVMLVVALCLAIFIPLLQQSNNGDSGSLKNGGATKENCYIATYNAEVSMTDMNYSEDLKNPYSSAYEKLATRYCNSLKENMEDLYECGEKIDSCRVSNFKEGSIKVNTEIRHTKIGKADNVKSVEMEKETKRIKDIVSEAILKGASGSNSDNLFKQEAVGFIEVEATDVDAYVQCPPVKTPRRSRILSLSPFVNYIDDQVTVKCEEGYYFPDGLVLKTITCLSSGKWSQELRDCEPKLCPEIPSTLLINSEVLLGNTSYNGYKHSVWIRCHHGYSFDPSNGYDRDRVVECQHDGKWNDEIETGCQEFDECNSNPCANGGTCTEGEPGEYNCECLGFEGKQCETDIDDCKGDRCQHGGTCFDEISGYRCCCQPGYTGLNCEIDECDPNPCLNGATCTNGENGYTCDCLDGYKGNNCKTDINECEFAYCANGGTCVDMINSYMCECLDGAGGDNCEIDTNDDCDGDGDGNTCASFCEICVDLFFDYECLVTCSDSK